MTVHEFHVVEVMRCDKCNQEVGIGEYFSDESKFNKSTCNAG